MIVLDTHAWIWWTLDPDRLSDAQHQTIKDNEGDCIGVSAISCWEIAKLCEYRRLELPQDVSDWFTAGLAYPGVALLPITPAVAVESTRLPGAFHRDPADQLIVATARVHDCELVSSDGKIIRYPHVRTIA